MNNANASGLVAQSREVFTNPAATDYSPLSCFMDSKTGSSQPIFVSKYKLQPAAGLSNFSQTDLRPAGPINPRLCDRPDLSPTAEILIFATTENSSVLQSKEGFLGLLRITPYNLAAYHE
jgi:hypothetical protein